MNRHIRVLLIEDDPGDAVLTCEAFAADSPGVTLEIATDGAQALRILRAYGPAALPDLILLDLNMPRMNGHDVLSALKDDEHLRCIPVVILTTSDSPSDVRESYRRQAACHIPKPPDFDHFVQVVKTLREFWTLVASLPPRDHSSKSASVSPTLTSTPM